MLGVMVKKRTLKENLYYNNVLVLSYRIDYPVFSSISFMPAVLKMNRYYKMQALSYQKYCRGKLYKQAVQEYLNAVKNNYPVRAFEAIFTYEVTYNKNCTVSLYFDKYEYTAGAHGNTVRTSDTWNLQTRRKVKLRQMFAPTVNYKAYILKSVIEQIKAQMASGENFYFEDYEKNVYKYFNESSFYLTSKGVVVYFQQYEIAPYSSGIPEFTIDYKDGFVLKPHC